MKRLFITGVIGILLFPIAACSSGERDSRQKVSTPKASRTKTSSHIKVDNKQSSRLLDKKHEVQSTINETRNKIRDELNRG